MSQLIIKHEGFRGLCYFDTGWVPTIGYGHTAGLKNSDVGVKRISKLEGLKLLESDLKIYEGIVNRRFPGLMRNLNRFNGVVSFVYNLGEGALDGKSTKIAKHIKAEDWQMAAAGMMHYIKDNGKVLNGLVTRRCEEASLLVRG